MHLFGIAQAQVGHQGDELVTGTIARGRFLTITEPWVEPLFFADGGDGAALVVVGGVDPGVVGQGKQPLDDGVVEGACVTPLQVGATAAANQ